MSLRPVSLAIASVCLMAACGPQNGPRVFGVLSGADTARLGESVATRVGTPEMGAVSVPRVYRWSPVDGRELWVWVACRGQGDSRACVLAIGAPEMGAALVLAIEPVGWSIATLSDGADRTMLLALGDDGRGSWRQMIMYDRDRSDVTFSRRGYADGM